MGSGRYRGLRDTEDFGECRLRRASKKNRRDLDTWATEGGGWTAQEGVEEGWEAWGSWGRENMHEMKDTGVWKDRGFAGSRTQPVKSL